MDVKIAINVFMQLSLKCQKQLSSVISSSVEVAANPPNVACNSMTVPGEGEAGIPRGGFPPGVASHWPLSADHPILPSSPISLISH